MPISPCYNMQCVCMYEGCPSVHACVVFAIFTCHGMPLLVLIQPSLMGLTSSIGGTKNFVWLHAYMFMHFGSLVMSMPFLLQIKKRFQSDSSRHLFILTMFWTLMVNCNKCNNINAVSFL